jgi:ribonuclease T1
MHILWRFLLAFFLATGSACGFSPDAANTIAANELPREAQQTLALIKQGGPFPFERDGVVFGNFEKILPLEKRGFYREYTVKTPGERSRGARRIVAGDTPPRLFYYTDDHYKSFRRIRE